MKQSTTFIIGAGASAEFGLPTGDQLKARIRQDNDFSYNDDGNLSIGSAQIWSTANNIIGNDKKIYEAGRRIFQGLPYSESIDSFIDKNREDDDIYLLGRLSICNNICTAERKSKLYFSKQNIYNTIDPNRIANTWISRLFQIVTNGFDKTEVNEIFSNVSFVIFNYDRCVEHFFFNALRQTYGLDEALAASVVDGIKIFHPYGTIGALPYLGKNQTQIEFGAEFPDLRSMYDRLSTYTRKIQDVDALKKLQENIKNSRQLCFLGFSYQQQNMDLLFSGEKSQLSKIMGTAWRLSDTAIKDHQLEILQGLGRDHQYCKPELKNLKCTDAIHEFQTKFR